jgi:hypothetical protein
LSLRLITAQHRVADEEKRSQKEAYRQLALVADENGAMIYSDAIRIQKFENRYCSSRSLADISDRNR